VGPFGAKGIGEPSLTPAAPAVASAVLSDAIGVPIRELPITPERVLNALKQAGKARTIITRRGDDQHVEGQRRTPGRPIHTDEIALIMETAARFEGVMRAGGRLTNMAGKVLATLFYEPSTRTRLSFESAMLRLAARCCRRQRPGPPARRPRARRCTTRAR